MQSILDTLYQIFLLENLSHLSCGCLIQHIYLMSCVRQNLMRPHVVRLILSQSFAEISSGFSSNCRVSSRFDTVRASITLHLHIPKFFLPSNFTKSILIGCGFLDFTVNRLSPAIPSTQCEKTISKNNPNRKDQIFTSEQN